MAFPSIVAVCDHLAMVPVDRLRTLGIVAHIDAGKTTLTERILFDAGAQRFCGEVDDGTATMDWMRQEQERGISIVAAATHVSWAGCELQIVDTPGHVDFTAEVERCMRVLDGVVVVLDAVRGVESQTQTVWRQADRWRTARIAFVNKMDRVGADFTAAVRSLAERFDCRPVVVTIPLFDGNGAFAGIGDPVRGTAAWFEGDVPDGLHERLRLELRRAHEVVVEICADVDDTIMADFVSGREVASERLLVALRRGCLRGVFVPVLAGAALHGRGVDALLDSVCDLLPSPVDRDRSDTGDAFPPADSSAPFCALVFKVEHADGEVRNYCRVFTGEVAVGDRVGNARTDGEFVLTELWEMHASHHRTVDRVGPGAIVVVPGVHDLQTGDTLRAPGNQRVLPMPAFSPTVLAAVFEPATPVDEAPLQRALAELLADDPTLQVQRDGESGLPLVGGMGELHLEIVASRVRERVGKTFHMSRPRVARRATIRRAAEARAIVQAPGDAARQAEAEIAVWPVPADQLIVDIESIARHPLATSIERQLRSLLASGTVLAHPAAGLAVAVLVLTGSGDAADVLLEQAVTVALGKAVEAAGRVDLEPEVEFEVRCPTEHRSVVLADLLARGAAMRHVSAGQLGALLQGRGRLAAFLGYATRLRSLTQGHGEVQLLPRGLVPTVDTNQDELPPRN